MARIVIGIKTKGTGIEFSMIEKYLKICFISLFLIIGSIDVCFASAKNFLAEDKYGYSSNTLPMFDYKNNISITSNNMIYTNITGVQIGKYLNEDGVAILQKDEAFIEYEYYISVPGTYNMLITYSPINSDNMPFQLNVKNGDTQYNGIKLFRQYKNIKKISVDENGNDIRSDLAQVENFISSYIKDSKGISADPIIFDMKEGKNNLKLMFNNGGIAIKEIKFIKTKPTIKYDEYIKDMKSSKASVNKYYKLFEAENTSIVSHKVLYPTYDKSSVDTSPKSSKSLKLNTIGQNNWKQNGQWIKWDFDVDTDGYYSMTFRARQYYVRGQSSTRSLYIDDEILFEELKNVQFKYSTNWEFVTLGENEPYYIYLKKGKHTLKMEASIGQVGPYINLFESEVLKLSNIYRKILMITGISPDPLRDYQIEKDIPNLSQEMIKLSANIRKMAEEIEISGGQSGSDAFLAYKLSTQLDSFVEKPDTIPARLSTFQSNISALSSWILGLKDQPLELDYFVIKGIDNNQITKSSNLFNQLYYRLESFVYSFFVDYSNIGDKSNDGDSLTVWVSQGRDQGQIIKDLTDNYFKQQYKINANISLVQQGIVEAIAAGKGPDIALFTPSLESVNLASRGQLVDLSQFPRHKEIIRRFNPNSLSPYSFDGGIYGYPLQQSFQMMFYRKDIFEELKINPPQNWNDFYKVLTVVQKSKLSVGIPVGTPVVPDNSIFDMLLFQNGGSYYKNNFRESNLNSQKSLAAFKQWTEFYSKYSIPLSYDFYNRFRVGEMPLGISDYTMYNQLVVAAPEIEGLWEMTNVPYTIDKNGHINNSTSGASVGCYMLKKIKNKQSGYKFIDWFTSTKIQTEYGIAVENVLGQGGRYPTANIEAIRNMNWTKKEAVLLTNQIKNVRMPESIPASYYVTRNITNAFRRVALTGDNSREVLFKYNTDINNEIVRKRNEMGLK